MRSDIKIIPRELRERAQPDTKTRSALIAEQTAAFLEKGGKITEHASNITNDNHLSLRQANEKTFQRRNQPKPASETESGKGRGRSISIK
jgi:hypothetical protein